MSLRVAIDVQHLYKLGGTDRGSRYVLPGGRVVWEAEAATIYAGACAEYLHSVGVEVWTNDPVKGFMIGAYASRNRSAIAWHADAYLACHVNAGGGRYALTENLPGNPGYGLGCSILGALYKDCPSVINIQTRELKVGDRGHVCIAAVPPWIAAVVCEPFFGDNQYMQPLLETPALVALGQTIGRGVLQWWQMASPPPA